MSTDTSLLFTPERYNIEIHARHVEPMAPEIDNLSVRAAKRSAQGYFASITDTFSSSLDGLYARGDWLAQTLPALSLIHI